jgi:hypothetical protein
MRRPLSIVGVTLAALLLSAGLAQAAAPTVGALAATNVQGVSALLKGAVDPEGEPTTYRFEYANQAGGGALQTATVPAGQGSTPFPARAAISGLLPSTTYRYRLVASNASGSASAEGSFSTTQGFGLLAGEAGFAVRAVGDDGGAATLAGSHPYKLDLRVGLRQGGEFEGQPGVSISDGDLRDLDIALPPGLLLNPDPEVIGSCTAVAFATPRSSPFETSRSGESCSPISQIGTVDVASAAGGGQVRRFGLFNLSPAPGIFAQVGFSAYGAPVVFDVAMPQTADGSYALSLSARNIPQRLDLSSLALSLWGTPKGASHDGERGNCLNEAEPTFPWAKCSIGPATVIPRLAYLSLPARCGAPLSFALHASSWQQPGASAQAESRDPGGPAPPLAGCGSLEASGFAAFGFLTDTKASSPSGYNFQLINDVGPLTTPSQRVTPPARKAVVNLPPGSQSILPSAPA